MKMQIIMMWPVTQTHLIILLFMIVKILQVKIWTLLLIKETTTTRSARTFPIIDGFLSFKEVQKFWLMSFHKQRKSYHLGTGKLHAFCFTRGLMFHGIKLWVFLMSAPVRTIYTLLTI